ncbi:MAG: zinc metallopeptidase [Candidatus Gastranaerophilales bacterium]|nr:zinc metallopeptidase [Candidatus Gastranaerophilales bacterium]
MFFYDSFYMIIAILGMILVFIPQMLVKSTFAKFSKIQAANNMTGADVAREILKNNGITNVVVEPVQGELTDHYDPAQKVVRLSEPVYNGTSVAAQGIAAHEIGHVIQDFKGYLPMKLRAGIFPAAQAGQQIGPFLLMGGIFLRMFMGMGGFTDLIALTGIVFYAGAVLFHIVTLPVEFNASFRALKALSSGGYLETSEISGARSVLGAAAMTYVATALYSLMELIYWIWQFFGRRD